MQIIQTHPLKFIGFTYMEGINNDNPHRNACSDARALSRF